MESTIDVVIPTLDGWELLERCLVHLSAQTVPHTVIVVDDGSREEIETRVVGRFPETKVVRLDRTSGFAVASNRGVAAGAADVVVLLNNDVEVRPDFLERLNEPLLADAAVGSSAAVLLQRDGTVIDAVGVTADPTLAGFPRLRGYPLREAARDRPVLTGPSGGAGAFRRTAWEQVRGLDENVFGYGEDVDLALRLSGAGWKTALASRAIGIHLGSASFGFRSARQRYASGFSRGYFLRRYGIIRGHFGPRALCIELLVCICDAFISRDLMAARGRLAGWKIAAGLPRIPMPPSAAVDRTISFRESVALRLRAYDLH